MSEDHSSASEPDSSSGSPLPGSPLQQRLEGWASELDGELARLLGEAGQQRVREALLSLRERLLKTIDFLVTGGNEPTAAEDEEESTEKIRLPDKTDENELPEDDGTLAASEAETPEAERTLGDAANQPRDTLVVSDPEKLEP